MQEKPEAVKITYLSLLINVLLGAGKCSVGLWVNSQAILADGLHSFTDLSTDIAVILGLKIAEKPEDENHHYGHHKFSSLCSLFITFVILIFCVVLILASARDLIDEAVVDPQWPAVAIAFISLLVKEWIFARTKSIAKKTKSRLLMANAWHHRTDSLSSILVFVALLAILIGGQNWAFLDKVVGIILGGFLALESIKMFIQACNDLLDTAPETEIINDIREHILPVEGALGYHKFRARRVGDMMEVDLHLQVEASLSVEAGHIIASKVKQNIVSQHPEVIDVLVHVEPAIADHIKEDGIYEWGGGKASD